MKLVDFIKGNEIKFGIDCLKYFEQYETMEEAWDHCEDPLCLIAILQCLLNPNYDLSIIGFLLKAIKLALPASDHIDYKKLIAKVIQHLEEYADGKINLHGFRKNHQE